MCDICLNKAKTIKAEHGKVWDGSKSVYLEADDLTEDEIAALIKARI